MVVCPQRDTLVLLLKYMLITKLVDAYKSCQGLCDGASFVGVVVPSEVRERTIRRLCSESSGMKGSVCECSKESSAADYTVGDETLSRSAKWHCGSKVKMEC